MCERPRVAMCKHAAALSDERHAMTADAFAQRLVLRVDLRRLVDERIVKAQRYRFAAARAARCSMRLRLQLRLTAVGRAVSSQRARRSSSARNCASGNARAS